MQMKSKPLPEYERQWKEEPKQIGFDDLLWNVKDKEEEEREKCQKA